MKMQVALQRRCGYYFRKQSCLLERGSSTNGCRLRFAFRSQMKGCMRRALTPAQREANTRIQTFLSRWVANEIRFWHPQAKSGFGIRQTKSGFWHPQTKSGFGIPPLDNKVWFSSLRRKEQIRFATKSLYICSSKVQ